MPRFRRPAWTPPPVNARHLWCKFGSSQQPIGIVHGRQVFTRWLLLRSAARLSWRSAGAAQWESSEYISIRSSPRWTPGHRLPRASGSQILVQIGLTTHSPSCERAIIWLTLPTREEKSSQPLPVLAGQLSRPFRHIWPIPLYLLPGFSLIPLSRPSFRFMCELNRGCASLTPELIPNAAT